MVVTSVFSSSFRRSLAMGILGCLVALYGFACFVHAAEPVAIQIQGVSDEQITVWVAPKIISQIKLHTGARHMQLDVPQSVLDSTQSTQWLSVDSALTAASLVQTERDALGTHITLWSKNVQIAVAGGASALPAATLPAPPSPSVKGGHAPEIGVPLSTILPKQAAPIAHTGVNQVLPPLLLVVLFIVVVLLFVLPKLVQKNPTLFQSLLNKGGGSILPLATEDSFYVVTSANLGQGRDLYLVRIRNRELVIATTPTAVSLISDLSANNQPMPAWPAFTPEAPAPVEKPAAPPGRLHAKPNGVPDNLLGADSSDANTELIILADFEDEFRPR